MTQTSTSAILLDLAMTVQEYKAPFKDKMKSLPPLSDGFAATSEAWGIIEKSWVERGQGLG